MNTSDALLTTRLRGLLPDLLQDHGYGVYELAQVCASRLHEPTCEIMTAFADCLCELVNGGQLSYDRNQNLVVLA